MRKKEKPFPHHTHPKLIPPPGFVAVQTISPGLYRGVLPHEKGRCLWVEVEKGDKVTSDFKGKPTKTTQLPGLEGKNLQRDWLRSLRLQVLKDEQEVEAKLGIKPRTWEGWEQGRPIPYFQAVRLAIMLWERHRFQWRD